MKVFAAALLLFAVAQAVKADTFVGPSNVDFVHGISDSDLEAEGPEGAEDGGGRIVSGGGSTASQGQFPWHAVLIVDGSSFCGASLISTTYLLTTAHCAQGVTIFTVRLGLTNLQVSQPGVITLTTNIKIVHPSYSSSTLNNDVALVRLSTAVSSTTYVRPIRLPSASLGVPANVSVVVCGYRTYGSNVVSSTMKYSTLTTITNANCALIFGQVFLPSSSFCAVSPIGSNPCIGDSGAAVALKEDDGEYTQVGLVTSATSNCQANYPSVFTRVGSFLSWISSNTGISIRP